MSSQPTREMENPSTTGNFSSVTNQAQRNAATQTVLNTSPLSLSQQLPIFPFGISPLLPNLPLMSTLFPWLPSPPWSTVTSPNVTANPLLSFSSFFATVDPTFPGPSSTSPGALNNVRSDLNRSLQQPITSTTQSAFVPIRQAQTAPPTYVGSDPWSLQKKCSPVNVTQSCTNRVQQTCGSSSVLAHIDPSHLPFKKRRFLPTKTEVTPSICKKTGESHWMVWFAKKSARF